MCHVLHAGVLVPTGERAAPRVCGLHRARWAFTEQLSIPVDRGVSGDLRFGVLIAV